MKALLWSLTVLVFLGCRSAPDVSRAQATAQVAQPTTVTTQRAPSPNVEVTTYGELRRMMHENATGSAVALSNILTPHTYALGALSELRGEVTILGGTVWAAYSESDVARVENAKSSAEQAALLVAARVTDWRDIPLATDMPWAALDATVEELAKAAGIDVEWPFPFLLDGKFEQLEWHVVDGTKLPAGPSNHMEHMRSAVKAKATRVAATALGFFSKRHHGVFTHHDANTHLHVVVESERATGHLDHAVISAGAMLRLPR